MYWEELFWRSSEETADLILVNLHIAFTFYYMATSDHLEVTLIQFDLAAGKLYIVT